MLDPINAVIADLGPLAPMFAVGGLGFILVLGAVAALAVKPKDPFERLNSSRKVKETQADPSEILRSGNQQDRLQRYSNFLEPQDVEEYSAIRVKLIQAGYREKSSVRIYYFAQLALGVGLMILGVLYTLFTQGDEPLTPTRMVLQTVGPGFLGYMAPKYWVTRRQEGRKEEISQGFPDSLDMLLVCVEAGQSLDQAIIRVAQELRTGFPALSEEFELVALEMKAGKDRTEVLRDLAERAGNDDVASFVTVLIQSQAYGTSIADALRVYAGEMRDKRVMRAEEKANTLPTKMTLVTMMLTVPPLLIILLGPSLIEIQKAFYGG